MTLLDTILALEGAASRQPSIKSIVRGDVFRLNALKDAQYGVFAWSQGQHEYAGDLVNFRFTLYYIDRLTDGGSNEFEVQSTGIEVLGGILRDLEMRGITLRGWSIQAFNQRFSDECAGAFATGVLAVGAATLCAETITTNNVTIY